ncbi:MAG: BON domain-containing protein [Rhodanobacteraceae bacterium]
MKALRTISVFALAAALGAGITLNTAVAAPQTSSSSDHSSSAGQAVSDGWITTKVKSELATTKGVKSIDISVTTVDGKVTLTGMALTLAGRHLVPRVSA